ncbi:DUF1906 domain-containing protein [Paenibacillus cremeus]|uniref:DUF1906 domain-containing protein n=1 Tax=Paenibacillus cremeus TaxID=2163881 RepID=A0A559K9F8_9BACL|nr:DUF1906 domain-containing protein [Paenibacillus cremeus]TVY08770.1 DUF1906 domain-containing protein [Paenibacillus cremeus]
MAKGFDCSTPLSAAKAQVFASQGYIFVGRYLADPGSWKRLSPAEAQDITDAGLYIVSFFERYANRAGEGAAAGTEDGQLALQYAGEVQQPEGSTIYAAVDYDASANDFDAIEAYMRAFNEQINGYELGVYGSYSVVKAMYERGVTSKLMQTYAWSGGKKFDPISIYQYQNDISQNGIEIDLDESNGDAGGWKVGGVITPEPAEPQLAPEDANKVIAYLSAGYMAIEDPAGREEFHRLANELRKASGQPTA